MWLFVCCNLLCFCGGVIMTIIDKAVAECLANINQSFARMDDKLRTLSESYGPQDVDASRADYRPGISKVKP